jgi:hypothetical protein
LSIKGTSRCSYDFPASPKTPAAGVQKPLRFITQMVIRNSKLKKLFPKTLSESILLGDIHFSKEAPSGDILLKKLWRRIFFSKNRRTR